MRWSDLRDGVDIHEVLYTVQVHALVCSCVSGLHCINRNMLCCHNVRSGVDISCTSGPVHM